jgi:hypothetical protein
MWCLQKPQYQSVKLISIFQEFPCSHAEFQKVPLSPIETPQSVLVEGKVCLFIYLFLLVRCFLLENKYSVFLGFSGLAEILGA